MCFSNRQNSKSDSSKVISLVSPVRQNLAVFTGWSHRCSEPFWCCLSTFTFTFHLHCQQHFINSFSARSTCDNVAAQTHQFLQSHDLRLVCNGYYPEIHIVHPRRLEILFSLSAQIQPDWVTALCVLRPVNREGIKAIRYSPACCHHYHINLLWQCSTESQEFLTVIGVV